MKSTVYTVLIGAALAACMGLTAHPETAQAMGGKCQMAGGGATMVTEDLAKYMATAALKNAIAAHGWTAQGPVKMKCDTGTGLPNCHARQKACG